MTPGLGSPTSLRVKQRTDPTLETQSLFGLLELTCGLPIAAALTETIYNTQLKGNLASASQVSQTLTIQGLRVEPITDDDAVWAGDRIAESRRNPAVWTSDNGETRNGTLSLGDGLVLAVAHRLSARAVTFDAAWANFPTMTFALFNPWKIQL